MQRQKPKDRLQRTGAIKIKLFRLGSVVDFQGERILINDGNERIYDYFVLGTGSDKMFRFTTPTAYVRPPYNVRDMQQTDYLEAITPIPIFSERAKQVLEQTISTEIDFYPVLIEVRGTKLNYYLGKTKILQPLIDEDRSTYMTIAGRSKLDQDVYLQDFANEFHIARDSKHRGRVCVTDKFVDLCMSAALAISFDNVQQ